MENIKLKNRYGQTHILEYVDDDMYIVSSNTPIRIIGNNYIEAIDFDGGPFISVGDVIQNKKVIMIFDFYGTIAMHLEDDTTS